MSSFIFEKNYKKLLKLIPDLLSLEPGDYIKSKSEPYMDLNLDVLDKEDNKLIIALSHYYEHHSGDLIADPDMELRVNIKYGLVEALTYQDSVRFQRVYRDKDHYYPKLQQSLNLFLGTWLTNCINQGHILEQKQFTE